MLDKKDYSTKVIKSPTTKKSSKNTEPKARTRTFRFPLHGVKVEATTVEEANKKLLELIKNI